MNVSRRGESPVIDIHCHAFCAAAEGLVAGHPRRAAEMARMNVAQGAPSAAVSQAMLQRIGPQLTDVNRRLADMDAAGVDIQVVSPAPSQYCHWAEDDLAETLVRTQNEHMAAIAAAHPDRLFGLGQLALQNPKLACAQLKDAVKRYGLRGVQITTLVEGVSIADPQFEPVFALAQDLECLVLLHPFAHDQGERLARYYLWNVIGQPLETTIALSELILSGVLDRTPRLKLCACHGGGYLPAYWGRLDHAYKVRPEAHVCAQTPSAYLKRIYFDTVVHDARQLRALIDVVGVSQVLAGSDYPYDMGEADLYGLIAAVEGLDEDERAAVLGDNATRLLVRTGEATT